MAASAKSSGSSSNHPEKLSEKLLKLMENENRPFAINEIHERIGKQFDKSMLEKCLQKHVHGNRIMERTNGKQKIFCFNNNLNKINIETVTKMTRSSLMFPAITYRFHYSYIESAKRRTQSSGR